MNTLNGNWVQTKKCNVCYEEKPIYCFHKRNDRKGAYGGRCKRCRKEGRTMRKNSDALFVLGQKRCCRCGKNKSLEDFSQAKRERDGLGLTCKACTSEWHKNLYRNNRESMLEANRVRWWANREKELARGKEYRESNLERENMRSRKYYQNNPDKALVRKHRRRDRKAIVGEGDISEEMENFIRSSWGNKCAICGKPQSDFTKRFALDHWYPLAPKDQLIGYPLSISNAVLMCGRDNTSKGRKMPNDVYDEKTVRKIERGIKKQAAEWERTHEENSNT